MIANTDAPKAPATANFLGEIRFAFFSFLIVLEYTSSDMNQRHTPNKRREIEFPHSQRNLR